MADISNQWTYFPKKEILKNAGNIKIFIVELNFLFWQF